MYKKDNNKTDKDIGDELIYSLIRTEIKQIRGLLVHALEGRRIKMLEELNERFDYNCYLFQFC
jgi:hypothetical protein